EDTRFYQHHGVDIRGVARAFVADKQAGANAQGASTLTMQYVRLEATYTASSPQQAIDATKSTLGRKIDEMHEAIAVEQQLTQQYNGSELEAKHEIIRRYLNIANFGGNVFGIYAASHIYFGVDPINLSVADAALLAGMVQAPSNYDPTVYPKAAVKRRNTHVLPAMLKAGYITATQEQQALAAPLGLHYTAPKDGCTQTVKESWGFFCDYLERWWDTQEAFGADVYTRQNALETGGYTIRSSLNIKDQAAADKSIAHEFSKNALGADMLVGVQPGSGEVQIMAVNRNFNNSAAHNLRMTDPAKYRAGITKGNRPNTTLPLLSGDLSGNGGYQFGSTFKMFTMIAALESGLPLNYRINAPAKYQSNFGNDNSPGNCGGYYCPTNSSGDRPGEYTMWTGFGKSINNYFVPLEDRLSAVAGDGPQTVVNVAKKLGLKFGSDNPNPAYGSFTLGTTGVYPLEMAAAYATVDADGMYCAPKPVVSISDYNHHSLAVAGKQCSQAIEPDIARAAIDAAHCPVGDGQQGAYGGCPSGIGTGVNTLYDGMKGRPWAGKSGTTDDGVADAFIGMTPQLTIAGELTDTDGGNENFQGIHSKLNYTVAHTMAAAVKGLPKIGWKPESRALAFGTPASVPSFKGCTSIGSASATLRSRGFKVFVQKKAVSSGCPTGDVATTDPTGTSTRGAIIALFPSSGQAPPPKTPPGNGGGPGGGGGGGGGGPTGPTPPPITPSTGPSGGPGGPGH
ncbi:MAG TPA: transglycosylase domain-containing protein, partial [Micromonosporaceae bacterium]